jgi:transcriptional regulator with XRE-family HTH domain
VDMNEIATRINQGPEARAAVLDEFLRISIPIQIRMLREDRKWTQLDLARRCDMTQSDIARLEKIGGPLPTIKTLQRIAAACDVGFVCKFASWSEFVKFAATFDDHVPSFDDDPGCKAA